MCTLIFITDHERARDCVEESEWMSEWAHVFYILCISHEIDRCWSRKWKIKCNNLFNLKLNEATTKGNITTTTTNIIVSFPLSPFFFSSLSSLISICVRNTLIQDKVYLFSILSSSWINRIPFKCSNNLNSIRHNDDEQ